MPDCLVELPNQLPEREDSMSLFSLLPKDGVCINVLQLNNFPGGGQIIVNSLAALTKGMIIVDNYVAAQ